MNLKTTVGILIITTAGLCLTHISIICYMGFNYNINAGGHLTRAASANNVTLAREELETALIYINKLPDGYTSILINTPDEDVTFWKRNLNEAHAELLEFEANIDMYTATDKSNQLMKLRETLTSQSEKGTVTNQPAGISRYPYNKSMAAFMFLYVTMTILTAGLWLKSDE